MWAEHQLKNLIIEMDAETIVRCVRGAAKLAAIDELIIDCIEVLARDCNVVTPRLIYTHIP